MSRNAASKKANTRVHVISRTSGWAIKREGSNRATKIYDRKDTAVRGATEIAKQSGSDVVIHKRDGSIQEWKKIK